MDLILVELLSVLSLLLALLLLFFSTVSPGLGMLLLLWSLAFFTSYHLLRRRWPWVVLMAPLAFLPMSLTDFPSALPFYILLFLPLFLYAHTSLGQAVHERITRRFRWSYGILFLITLLGIGFPAFRRELSSSLPFVVLHIFSTILLTSSLRHREAGIDGRKSARRSYSFVFLAFLLSGLGALPAVRSSLLQGFQAAYDWVYSGLIRLLFLVVWVMANVVFYIAGFFFHEVRGDGNPLEFFGDVAFGTDNSEALILREQHPLVNIVLTILLVSGMAFLLFKVFLHAGRRRVIGMDFKEEREFLTRTVKQKRRIRREKLPVLPKEQIRYYYRRYLEHLQKASVPLSPSDTSLDIERKGTLLDSRANKIRHLYVKARYTDLPVEKEDVAALKEWLE